MKAALVLALMVSCTFLSGQSPNGKWGMVINWNTVEGSRQDTTAILELEITDIPNPEEVDAVYLEVTDRDGSIHFEGEVPIAPSSFAASENICRLEVPSVRSGFYRYKAKLVYEGRSRGPAVIKDQTLTR